MSQNKYPKAYEAYQQAVYRDGRNPTFWCSIGVLYYQINQYRDALDAYSRAIRLNPYISEVWYDLGTLVGLTFIITDKGKTANDMSVRVVQQPDQRRTGCLPASCGA
jgi:cytochrome c-type biogenesis protein CcmH/NrfG